MAAGPRLGAGADRLAFEHLLDQVDAAARAVELVAEYLVGRARRIAEAAVHAGAQDRLRFIGPCQGLACFAEMGLHRRIASEVGVTVAGSRPSRAAMS